MSRKAFNREKFIQLYRRKLQNDLDNMGYPGGNENDAASSPPSIIDVGSELSGRKGDSVSINRRKAIQP